MSKLYGTKELKAARIRKNWSQQELADIIRVQAGVKASQSLVQKWENGVRPIVLDTAIAVARILNTSIDKITERRDVTAG